MTYGFQVDYYAIQLVCVGYTNELEVWDLLKKQYPSWRQADVHVAEIVGPCVYEREIKQEDEGPPASLDERFAAWKESQE